MKRLVSGLTLAAVLAMGCESLPHLWERPKPAPVPRIGATPCIGCRWALGNTPGRNGTLGLENLVLCPEPRVAPCSHQREVRVS